MNLRKLFIVNLIILNTPHCATGCLFRCNQSLRWYGLTFKGAHRGVESTDGNLGLCYSDLVTCNIEMAKRSKSNPE